MPKPADALYRDELSGTRLGISECVVDRDASTHQRRRFVGRQIIGHQGHRFSRNDQVFLVASIKMDGGNFLVPTVEKVTATARFTGKTMPSVPTHADALPGLPLSNIWTHHIDASCDLVTRNAGILKSGPLSFFNERIAVADATRLDLDANLAARGLRDGTFHKFKVSTGLADLNGFHGHLSFRAELRKWSRHRP
jgi:hypothetical protein